MVTQIAIVILSAVGMFVIWYFFLRKDSKDVPEPTPDVPVSYLTPKGATVYSKVEVPASALAAIDDGLQATIDRMPAGWSGGRNISEYKIQFVAPVGFTAEGVPYLTFAAGSIPGDMLTAYRQPMRRAEAITWSSCCRISKTGRVPIGSWEQFTASQNIGWNG
jgi:hypothetical protein